MARSPLVLLGPPTVWGLFVCVRTCAADLLDPTSYTCAEAVQDTPCAPTTWFDAANDGTKDASGGSPTCCKPCPPNWVTDTLADGGAVACVPCPPGTFSRTAREPCRPATAIETSAATDISYQWHPRHWVDFDRERKGDIFRPYLVVWNVVFVITMVFVAAHVLNDIGSFQRTRSLRKREQLQVPSNLQ